MCAREAQPPREKLTCLRRVQVRFPRRGVKPQDGTAGVFGVPDADRAVWLGPDLNAVAVEGAVRGLAPLRNGAAHQPSQLDRLCARPCRPRPSLIRWCPGKRRQVSTPAAPARRRRCRRWRLCLLRCRPLAVQHNAGAGTGRRGDSGRGALGHGGRGHCRGGDAGCDGCAKAESHEGAAHGASTACPPAGASLGARGSLPATRTA